MYLDHEPVGDPCYGDASVYASPPPPKRRRQLVGVASVVVLLLGAVVVDRVAAGHAESRTARAFQDGMGTPLPPEVHVRGFPVLTQLAAGRLDHVDLVARDIPAEGADRPLPVTRLTVGLDGLETSGSAEEARARAVDATAFLSYDDVSDALGVTVVQGDAPGRVEATATVPLVGEVTVSAKVSAAAGNRVAFSDVRAVDGELLPPLKALLDRALSVPVPLRNVPDGLRLRSVSTARDGIDARFTGRSVTFRPG
ncbi:DUF2993 domain-containing protein [Streptomyces sp. NPDC090075]|uniref:LmeA family phospholipid-binding protein n=1 Tax=Streptomyces sp. NPDC090075 TaxID=3365937 RepID=UPI0037F2884C